MQPTFLPWVGYFDLIDAVDKFVLYDDVQFTKQSWQCRNRIKTANNIAWITVPLKKHDLAAPINQIEINNSQSWATKLLKTLFYNYQNAEHFHETYSFIEDILSVKQFELLSCLTIYTIQKIVNRLGINTELLLSSAMDNIGNQRDERLVKICQHIGCDNYLSTRGSSSYFETGTAGDIFAQYKISLNYHSYHPQTYRQAYGDFEPYMSIIDLLFNEGFDNSLDVIRRGRRQNLRPEQLESP